MSLSIVTYALSKKYTDSAVIHAGEEIIDEAVRRSKDYTDYVATSIEWKKEIVETLPQDPDPHTIYFVPATEHPENDGYFEYMYLEDEHKWEVIGRTVVDMSDYYTKEEVEQYVLEHAYVLPAATDSTLGGVKVDTGTIELENDGTISIGTISSEDIDNLFKEGGA